MSAAAPFGPDDFRRVSNVSRETFSKLTLYVETLRAWQKRINLVAASTLPDVWRRHVLDSWQLVPLAPPKTEGVWIDLGSGAGFPGLVAALCLPSGWTVHCVESDVRKAAFLREVIRQTRAPAQVHAVRLESLPPFDADVISARALAPMAKLLPLVERFWRPGTLGLFLKGKSLNEELETVSGLWTLTYDLVESLSDSSGRIVRLRNLERVH